MLQRTGRIKNVRVPVSRKPVALPPEANPWWWHPGRVGVRSGPPTFSRKLEEIDPNLAVTWDSYHERWIIWLKKPEIQTRVCWGWNLLFIVQDEDKNFLPLDERVFHRLYEASARKWGGAKAYFDAVERDMAARKESREKRDRNERDSQSSDLWQHWQPSVGYGKSNGSKFSTYLS